jgi:large subunit ribosomal protein L16
MLIQGYSKYAKSHNGKYGSTTKGVFLRFGDWAMVATESLEVKQKQVNAAYSALRKKMKNKGRVYCRVYLGYSKTKKPIKSKMGGGKGKFDYFAACIKKGKVLFEISNVGREEALEFFRIAGSKLPIGYLVRDF